MQIILTAGLLPRLENPDDFSRFSIVLDPSLSNDRQSAVAAIGTLHDDDHVWVRPDAIRALSPLAHQTDWQTGFVTMCDGAAKYGFVDDLGRIRAHIEMPAATATVDPGTFRSAMRRFAAGVCVVASGQDDSRCGMTVSAFSSVSAEPPMVLVCLNRSSFAHASLTKAASYSINILGAEQQDTALLFAGQKGLHGAERFRDGWQQNPHGAPVLSAAHQSIVCTPEAQYQAGSHTVLIGRVVDASQGCGKQALVNYDGSLLPTMQTIAA